MRAESAALPASIVERLPVGICVTDARGRVLSLNAAAVRVLGPEAGAAILGGHSEHDAPFALLRPDGTVLPPDEWPTARAVQGEEVREERVQVRHPDGQTVHLMLSGVRDTSDPAGDRLVFLLQDETEAVEAERSLREREARLSALFTHIDEGYCLAEMITDEDGGPVDYRFLEVNPLFEAMTGLHDATGRTALELVPDLEQQWIETYGRVGLGGERLRFEQGSAAMGRWFDVFATPVEPRGRFALVFKDITARRDAEVARDAADRGLQTALAVKDEFLGHVSHELRTPLTVIYGMSRVLARSDLDPDEARALGADIAESAEALNALVESMLLLARIDVHEAVQYREPVLLQRAAADVVAAARTRYPTCAFELRVTTQDTLVDVQPGWLGRVIENLVGNAAKYAGPGTRVTTEIDRVPDGVRLRVLDEGPGLADEDLERVFEPFYRTEDARQRASGSGLGLAVSRRIVELLGGRIWAARRPEGGAEFGFVLPLADEG